MYNFIQIALQDNNKRCGIKLKRNLYQKKNCKVFYILSLVPINFDNYRH